MHLTRRQVSSMGDCSHASFLSTVVDCTVYRSMILYAEMQVDAQRM